MIPVKQRVLTALKMAADRERARQLRDGLAKQEFMRYPPLRILRAVEQGHIDHRVRRQAAHFRHFFRVFDAHGQITTDPEKVEQIRLTQRAQAYMAAQRVVA